MAEPKDEWVPIQEQPATTAPKDEWVPIGTQAPTGVAGQEPAASKPPEMTDPGTFYSMASAFGEAFHEDWKEPLGLSPENSQLLSKIGIFAPSDRDRYTNPFQAMNELLAVSIGAGIPRAFSSVIHGTQAALRAVPQSQVQKLLGERTLSAEMAGFLDYFQTGQAELGIPHPPEAARPGAVEIDIKGTPFKPDVVAYHGSTDVIHEFDPAKTQHGAVFFSEQPELANKFAQDLATDSDPIKIFGDDPTPKVKAWVTEMVGEKEGNRIGALMDEFEGANEAKKTELHNEINDELHKISSLSEETGGGAPNISRAGLDLGEVKTVDMGGKFDWDKEREAIDSAKAEGYDSVRFTNSGERGNFYAVFNKDQIRPTATVDLQAARDLGVIGPEKPEPAFTDSPSALAERALPHELSAQATPETEQTPLLGHSHGEYDARGKEWIDKIDAPEDVRDAIEKIADDHDYFPVARGGVASEAARNAVAEAAGVAPADIDTSYFATHFDNDGKVRAVIQVLRQTTKDFMDASEKALKEPTMENLAAAKEAEMRHAHALEYTMGLRAESGRSLAAWKDLLREQERDRAKIAVKAGEQAESIPVGVSPVMDAAREVQDNLRDPKAPKLGLQKLVDAAKDLVDKEDKAPVRPAPLPPEVAGLVGEARKVLKRFGADKDAELESFRQSLEKLSKGEGKIDDVVEAARALVERIKKPAAEAAEEGPKTASTRGQLVGAAKRLIAATDKATPAEKRAMPEATRSLMEAARQAIGRIKQGHVREEFEDFREALNEGDPRRAVEAAKQLIATEPKPVAGQPRPIVEHDQVMATARKLANTDLKKLEGKQQFPPDIKALMEETQKAAAELKALRESELGKLIDQAEKQAVNMTKQKMVKKPVEALPPELQALVDKTERIVDRFGGIGRGERAALLLGRTGKTAAEQEQIVRSVAGLNPNQVARVLQKLATTKLEQPHWFFWLWQQGLISGLVTHTGYAIVNTATIYMERVISPLLGAAIGKMRGQNVSLMAPLHANIAFIHALPDAFAGAGEAFRTGNRVPLASELRLFERGEESPQTKGARAAYTPPSPDWGIWKRVFNEDQLESAARVLGIPGRSANLQHTFFKILSEQASATMRAYEAAFEEGARGDRFNDRYQYHLNNPSDDALREQVNDAYTGAFMAKLGDQTTRLAHALSKNPVLKWVFPFQHIPWNMERMTAAYSPLAVLGPEMREAILGRKGEPAQNLAIARMAVGSSILGYFIYKGMIGDATGDYPTDPKERRRWELMGIKPNSIKLFGYYVSMERTGPPGNLAAMGASLGQIIHDYDGQDDEAMAKAIFAGSLAAVNQLGEVGFLSLKNLITAMESPKQLSRYIAQQAGTLVPSLVGQAASFFDPEMRKANDIISGLKYRVPGLRETLPAKLDPLYGTPVPNPGYLAIKRQGPIQTDPIKLELDRLGVYPAAPEDHIGGVKLPPELYDKYQRLAGEFVRMTLQAAINEPRWASIPVGIQADLARKAIERGREAAGKILQGQRQDMIQLGVQNKVDAINGGKPAKLKDQPAPAASSILYIPPGETHPGGPAPPAPEVPGVMTGPRA